MYTAAKQPQEMFNLRGMNMVLPDQVLTDSQATIGQVPIAYNSRMYARHTDGETRAPIESRNGAKFYFSPVGETVDVQQTSTTGEENVAYGLTTWYRQSFTPTVTKALTMIELELTANDSLDVSVLEIQDVDGTTLAESAAPSTDLSTATQFRFPQAPTLTAGTTYKFVLRTQEKYYDTQTHYVKKTSATSGTLEVGTATYAANDPVASTVWTATTGSLKFKTYLSNVGQVLGADRREDTSGTKETLFVHGTTLYKVDEVNKVPTVLHTGLSASATIYRFTQTNNITYIVNGYDNMLKYDGTTVTSVTLPHIPDNIIHHKNRLFWTTSEDRNRVFFSNLYPDIETSDSVNFFYVPDPQTSDPIMGWALFQDQLVIFTYEKKFLLAGNDLSTFTLRESTGTKGAVSQEAIAVSYNQIYFMADDNRIYAFNGSTDYYLSEPIQPELTNIQDPAATHLILWDRQLRIYYKSGSSTEHDRMALYYLTHKEWFIDTETYTCYPLYFDKDPGNPLVEFSSKTGTAYYAEQTEGAHLGAPIDWQYYTPYEKFDSGLAKDRIKKFRPYFESPDSYITVQVGKDVDFKESPKMRDYQLSPGDGITDKATPMSGRGKLTQFRFEKRGSYTKVRLKGFGFIRTSARAR